MSSGQNVIHGGEGASVRFDRVYKSYMDVHALHDVSFTIEAGEFITLLGPSGSGKSSLLMALAGFEKLTSGEIFIDDKPMGNVPPNRRSQGVVFQSYALFPHMTVRENLGFPLAVRGIEETQAARMIDRVLETTRISKFAGRYPGQLSGGQQQRVALARALVFNPPLLLMDESFSALDRNLREEMQLELKAMHTELSTTIVFVTHDQGEALTMSDRIVVLKDGSVEQFGSPRALYQRPGSAFVARFMGDANLIPVTLAVRDGGKQMAHLAGGRKIVGQGDGAFTGRAGVGALAVIRSEAIRIGAATNLEIKDVNALLGTVRRAIYAGDSWRYWVDVDGIGELSVRSSSFQSGQELRVLQRVVLEFDPEWVSFVSQE